jgi:hypothetical protein
MQGTPCRSKRKRSASPPHPFAGPTRRELAREESRWTLITRAVSRVMSLRPDHG